MKLVRLFVISVALVLQARGTDVEFRASHEFISPALVAYDPETKPVPKPEFNSDRQVFKNLKFWITITNHGSKEIKIPTAGWDVAEIEGKGKAELLVRIAYSFERGPSGEVQIVPESSLGLVTLRQGETTVIRYETIRNEDFKLAVKIVYFVAPDFAQRYGLWSGKVEVVSKLE